MILHLSDGSGSFHLDYEPKDIALVEYSTTNRTVQVYSGIFFFTILSLIDYKFNPTEQITPLMNGELKITVTDQCLWTRQPAFTTIQVLFYLFTTHFFIIINCIPSAGCWHFTDRITSIRQNRAGQ
jgi:hypothetical protein